VLVSVSGSEGRRAKETAVGMRDGEGDVKAVQPRHWASQRTSDGPWKMPARREGRKGPHAAFDTGFAVGRRVHTPLAFHTKAERVSGCADATGHAVLAGGQGFTDFAAHRVGWGVGKPAKPGVGTRARAPAGSPPGRQGPTAGPPRQPKSVFPPPDMRGRARWASAALAQNSANMGPQRG